MSSSEQEPLQLIMVSLDYCAGQITETKRSLRESLAAGNVTAPLTLLEQSETDLDSLRAQVLKLRSEIESAVKAGDDRFGKLKLDGASKDILVMALGMYELDLIKTAASPEGANGTDKSTGSEAKLRLINETKSAFDL